MPVTLIVLLFSGLSLMLGVAMLLKYISGKYAQVLFNLGIILALVGWIGLVATIL